MDNHPIFKKIEEGVVTAADFNQLIQETTPEATRDRTRRRTLRNASKSHKNASSGHQQLELPTFADRIQPKREKANNTQMHSRGKVGHRHSTRTQRRKASVLESIPDRYRNTVGLIVDNIGNDLTDALITELRNQPAVQAIIGKMMAVPDIDRNWLTQLLTKLRHA